MDARGVRASSLCLAIDSLRGSLPNTEVVVFQRQQHNAMDTIPQQFAETVLRFLLAP
jgi:hypothetical protein